MEIVGGTTAGYGPTGSPVEAITPQTTITSESTVAKTGLLIKNWLITVSPPLGELKIQQFLQQAGPYCLHGRVTCQR